MGSFSLRVTPEILESMADDFWKVIGNIDGHFQRILEISENTRGYWHGDAGNTDREGFDSFREDIAFILYRLDEHPSDLLKMAGIYKTAERTSFNVNSRLKTDMIV